jgi:hypothetical protein
MNGADCAAAFDVLIQTLEDTKEYYKEGGEYLPLSVWAARGFDAVAIESRSRDSDVMEDPVLGTVYRVRILQKGNSGCRTTLTTRTLKRKLPLPPQTLGGAGSSGDGGFTIGGDGPLAIGGDGPPAFMALEDGTASSGGDSSSTTSSDSSSSSDKKKKHKKGKKGKKDKKSKKSKKGNKDKKKDKKDKKDKKAPKDF